MSWQDEYDYDWLAPTEETDIWNTAYDWSAETEAFDPWLASVYADPSRALDVIETPEQANEFLSSVKNRYGDAVFNTIKGFIFKPGTDELNLANLGKAGLALWGMMGGNEPKTAGYNVAIPTVTGVRSQIPYAQDPNRRPGEAGRNYFTNMQYVAPSEAAATQTAHNTRAAELAQAYKPSPTPTPVQSVFKTPWEKAATTENTANATPASGVAQLLPVPDAATYAPATGVKTMADGGIAALARGRYLAGKTDGMADEIPTSIDGKDPAALSHGEFVIPADVVSHLGNGNSEAGAQKLYAMMDRVRKARTGTTKQGKRINPDKFMPGGLAGYAGGGEVKGFDGTTGSVVPAAGTSSSSSLSPWAGPYVTNMLARGEAIAQEPYQAYQGPLTAGASDLQNQAFSGIQTLAGAGYTPTTFTGGTFGAEQAQQYMNPYIQSALNPQLAEMKRQSDIARMGDAARLSKAGAFGGSRQAIMESEGARNLLEKQTQAIGTGYQTAYDKAMGQYNADQDRRLNAEKEAEASRQFSANYGLKSLGDMATMGQTQRDITAEGIAADKRAFEEQRDYPADRLEWQRKLITGLPMSTQATTANTTPIGNVTSSIAGSATAWETLMRLLGGYAPASTSTTTTLPASSTAI